MGRPSAAKDSSHLKDPLWEKQKGENGRAFRAFCIYRNLGVNRSIALTAKEFYKSKEAKKRSTQGTLSDWSSRHFWVSRADAWDLDQQRKDDEELADERVSARKRRLEIAQEQQTIALRRLREIYANEKKRDRFTIHAALRMMELGMRNERLELGEATDRIESTGADGQPIPVPTSTTEVRIYVPANGRERLDENGIPKGPEPKPDDKAAG
jgi:hypothetical protein